MDGVTIDLDTDLGFRTTFRQRYRLYGLDTPELNDPDPAVRALAVKVKGFVPLEVGGLDILINTHTATARRSMASS